MTFTEAAALVLRLVGKPLHYKDITDVAIAKGLLSHVGKSPEVTMGSRLNSLLKKPEKENPLKRVKPGVFALRDWDDKQIDEGLKDKRAALDCIDEEQFKVALAEVALLPPSAEEEGTAAHVPLDDVDVPEDDEEKHRAELSQGASELFASEDDDDKPIFASEDDEEEVLTEGDAQDRNGKRRRRRRRGRGRREENGEEDTNDDLPAYTVSDADPEEVVEAVEIALEVEAQEGGSEVPLDLARSIEVALGSFDRSRGPVAAQNILDQLRKRLKGDLGLSPAALVAVALFDNQKSTARGYPPRFRVQGGKLGLTSWGSDRRADESRRALGKALEQVRGSQVRLLTEQLGRLSQRSLGEVILLLLDRMGATSTNVVRRPGAHGSELHLTTTLKLKGIDTAWGSVRTAVVVRRDGRDIGRERVAELRGALHHYGSAGHGWLISTGQVLSGAKEEAQSSGASPVSLSGKSELAELLIDYGVLVQKTTIEVPSVDLELIDALSGR